MNLTPTSFRNRTAILADILAIENTVEGTLTVKKHICKDGTTSLYHQLQLWENGKNKTVCVPADKVEAVKQGIERQKQLDALVHELKSAGTHAVLAGDTDQPAKKKTDEIQCLIQNFGHALTKLYVLALASMMQNGLGLTCALEKRLHEQCVELCRKFMEQLLNTPGVPVPENHPRPNERLAGHHDRDAFCNFGRIRLKNRAYFHNAQTKKGRFPADEALGLQHGGATPAFAQRAMKLVAAHSYQKAAQHLRDEGLKQATPDLLKAICKKLGPKARRYWREAPAEPARKGVKAVVIATDGAAVPLLPRELRGVKGRAADGKAKTGEAKIGVRYEALFTPGEEHKRVDGSLRLVATLGNHDVFGELLRADYLRDHQTPPDLVLFMGDGAKWIWNLCRVQFPFAVEILDFYHAMANLDPLLELWGLGDGERKGMRAKWKDWLLAGKVGDLIGACEARSAGAQGERAKAWKRAIGYYRSNRGRMRYDEYQAKGWPIGSGAVEGACKTVVVERFQCAGMRWLRKGASNVLPFRTACLSNRTEALWRFMLGNRKMLAVA
jgi:hypothetical protein